MIIFTFLNLMLAASASSLGKRVLSTPRVVFGLDVVGIVLSFLRRRLHVIPRAGLGPFARVTTRWLSSSSWVKALWFPLRQTLLEVKEVSVCNYGSTFHMYPPLSSPLVCSCLARKSWEIEYYRPSSFFNSDDVHLEWVKSPYKRALWWERVTSPDTPALLKGSKPSLWISIQVSLMVRSVFLNTASNPFDPPDRFQRLSDWSFRVPSNMLRVGHARVITPLALDCLTFRTGASVRMNSSYPRSSQCETYESIVNSWYSRLTLSILVGHRLRGLVSISRGVG